MKIILNKNAYIFILAIVLAAIGFFAFVSEIHAGNTGLSIQPLKASHTLKPGESMSGVIQITNVSDDAVNVEIKVEDFVPLAGTYNIQIVQRASGISTVRDWIILDAPQSFVLAKGAAKNVTYTIKAPFNAEPGGHFGVALFKASELPKGGQQLKVGTQVGMLLFITVPGDFLQKGRILDFTGPKFIQKGQIDFKIKFENTGTVHFEPKGQIEIKNMFGKIVGQTPVSGTAVLPTGVKEIVARWDIGNFLWGRYTASIRLFDGEGNELTADKISFYGFPLWYAVGFILTVIILFFGIKFLKKKIRFSISLKDNNKNSNE